MEKAIELFGFLILTTMALTVPVAAILLSVYQEGILSLAAQYKIKKAQAKMNISEQIRQTAENVEAGSAEMESSLDELKAIEKGARAKLSYMNPKMLVAKIFISLMIALFGVFFAMLFAEGMYKLSLVISVAAFLYALYVMWRTIGTILEAKASIDADGKSNIEQVTNLLSGILAKIGKPVEQHFLKNVKISLDESPINDESFTKTMTVNEKQQLTVSCKNSEMRMAKRIEVGFIFSKEFIINDSIEYSIFRSGAQQVVRFHVEEIHADTDLIFFEKLIITPVKKGIWKVSTFVKGENIEAKYIKITLKVV